MGHHPRQTINAVMDFEDEPIQELRREYDGAIGFMDQQVGRNTCASSINTRRAGFAYPF